MTIQAEAVAGVATGLAQARGLASPIDVESVKIYLQTQLTPEVRRLFLNEGQSGCIADALRFLLNPECPRA